MHRRAMLIAKDASPPPPKSLIARIREMPPKSYLFLAGAKPDTVKVLANRVRTKATRRRFKTRKSDGGVQIWRLA